ncbi:hypothetical protein MASR2M66_17410 [Chloroflexota bacterium]
MLLIWQNPIKEGGADGLLILCDNHGMLVYGTQFYPDRGISLENQSREYDFILQKMGGNRCFLSGRIEAAHHFFQ